MLGNSARGRERETARERVKRRERSNVGGKRNLAWVDRTVGVETNT